MNTQYNLSENVIRYVSHRTKDLSVCVRNFHLLKKQIFASLRSVNRPFVKFACVTAVRLNGLLFLID